MAQRLPLFATASRGTEPFLAQELEALGASKVRQDRGGVRFHANLDEAVRICLSSRIAMRVLLPLGTADVSGAEGLYEGALDAPWEEWLTARSTFAVEATLRESEHTHSGFVALKIKDAIADRLRQKLGSRPDVDSRHPDVRVVAHLAKTQLSLSLDLCGEPLFKRGYRVKTTPAPLKETLAAALLAAAGYEGEEPFADPMCGSGTLAIEAGLIACRRAPGLDRELAIEHWPTMKAQVKPIVAAARAELKARVRPAPFPLFARDKDEEALEAARRNVRAAGLSSAVTLELADATHAGPPPGPPGVVVTNPPYGERLGTGGQKGMKSFYFKLGEQLATWEGWRFGVLVGNPGFESAFHRRPSKRHSMWNGPIECQVLLYPVTPGP